MSVELIDKLLPDMSEESKTELHEGVHDEAIDFVKAFGRDKLYRDLAPTDLMTGFCVTNRMVERFAKQPAEIVTGNAIHELLMLAFYAGYVWRDRH